MTRQTIFAASIAALTLAAGTAMAMEPSMPRSQRAFAKLDQNSDGKVTVAELAPKAEKSFFRMDADKNGEVTSAEIDAALTKLINARRNRMLKSMDADNNGAVTKAELDSFVTTLMTAADSNTDGGVSLDEARSFRMAKLKK